MGFIAGEVVLPSLLGEARQSISDSRGKLGNDKNERHCWAKPGNLFLAEKDPEEGANSH